MGSLVCLFATTLSVSGKQASRLFSSSPAEQHTNHVSSEVWRLPVSLTGRLRVHKTPKKFSHAVITHPSGVVVVPCICAEWHWGVVVVSALLCEGGFAGVAILADDRPGARPC